MTDITDITFPPDNATPQQLADWWGNLTLPERHALRKAPIVGPLMPSFEPILNRLAAGEDPAVLEREWNDAMGNEQQ